jgi:hypothetical protein
MSVTGSGTRSERRWWLLSGTWWVALGALFGFGIVGLLTIGLLLLALGFAMAVAGAVMPGMRNKSVFRWLASHGTNTTGSRALRKVTRRITQVRG